MRAILPVLSALVIMSLAVGVMANAAASAVSSQAETVPNVVLVHGAWADGSSWSGVIRQLQEDGYHVTAVQLALNSLADDAARTRQVLEAQEGPTILVAHSYGGAVITSLGADAPNVVGLVYVAAFAPDEGESLQGLLEQAAEQGIVSEGNAHVYPDEQGYLWLEREAFVKFFAPDVDPVEAQTMAAVQKPLAASISGETFGEPAWRSLPAWYLVAEDDQMVPAAAQHFMAERMGATVSSVAASHAVMVSQPEVVADLITTVAETVEVSAP